MIAAQSVGGHTKRRVPLFREAPAALPRNVPAQSPLAPWASPVSARSGLGGIQRFFNVGFEWRV